MNYTKEEERMIKALHDERVERKAQLEAYLLEKEAKASGENTDNNKTTDKGRI